MIVYDIDGNIAYQFTDREIHYASTGEPVSIPLKYLNDTSLYAENFNSTTTNHPGISAGLERQVEGLQNILLNEHGLSKTDLDKMYLDVMIHLKEATSLETLPDFVIKRYHIQTLAEVRVPITKIYDLTTIPEVISITDVERPTTFGITSSTSENFPLSLKHQIKQGIEPMNVICKEGLELIFKSSNNSPACVKPKTAEKLIERGWARV